MESERCSSDKNQSIFCASWRIVEKATRASLENGSLPSFFYLRNFHKVSKNIFTV